MFSSACLLVSAVILFYVLKYRVHVHVTYTPSSNRRTRLQTPARAMVANPRGCRAGVCQDSVPTAMTRPVHPESVVWGDQETTPILDIQSALVNLGAKPKRAKAAAEHVCRNWPDADFSTQLRAALQEVAA